MTQGRRLQGPQGIGIEIHIGQRAEQRLGREIVHGHVNNPLGARLQGNVRQFAQLRHKGILNIRNFGLLAANADLFAAPALVGLFALVAEHVEFLRMKGVSAADGIGAQQDVSLERESRGRRAGT